MGKRVLLDSCYWYALFTPRDKYHPRALEISKNLVFHTLVFPWPVMYECLNSRLTRRPGELSSFKAILGRANSTLVPDEKYRDESLCCVLDHENSWGVSLVDRVLIAMIEDVQLGINALITFNTRDFERICYSRGIEILS